MLEEEKNWTQAFQQAKKRIALAQKQIKKQEISYEDIRKCRQCLALFPKQNVTKICSQGHRFCTKCILKLNSIYSQCPQCNQVFDIQVVQRKMTKKRSFCLYLHYDRKSVSILKDYCSNCGEEKLIQNQCGVCNFKICNPCKKRWCDKFCQRQKRYIPQMIRNIGRLEKQRAKRSCCQCGQLFCVGQTCEYCLISICFKCSIPSSKIT